jgi:hypothetical protein
MPENITQGLHTLDKPWEVYRDMKTTQATIKRLLSGGTPNWIRFPRDYKAFAQETIASEKEISDKMAFRYKMDHQEDLINETARKVNPWRTRDFIQKLRSSGIQCFTVDNGFPKSTVALWALKPGTDKLTYVCFLQIPAMWEYSVLQLDKRGLPAGEAYRGWRTVEMQLIEKGIVSEDRANQIFGKPVDGPVSRRFRKNLFWLRNRRELDGSSTWVDQD